MLRGDAGSSRDAYRASIGSPFTGAPPPYLLSRQGTPAVYDKKPCNPPLVVRFSFETRGYLSGNRGRAGHIEYDHE